jgi:hypothetical protein
LENFFQVGSRVSPRQVTYFYFASPKKSMQKKGEPNSSPGSTCQYAALLGLVGVPLELGYRLKQSRSLIHPQLRSSAQTEGVWGAVLVALPATLQPNRKVRCNAQHRRASGLTPAAVMHRRVAQGWTDQGTRLFERSEFERDPTCSEHGRLPEAQRRDADSGVAFLLLTFLWRSKEK